MFNENDAHSLLLSNNFKIKILVAETSEATAKKHYRDLIAAGYNDVHISTVGIDTLEMMIAHKHDVVLLDMKMIVQNTGKYMHTHTMPLCYYPPVLQLDCYQFLRAFSTMTSLLGFIP